MLDVVASIGSALLEKDSETWSCALTEEPNRLVSVYGGRPLVATCSKPLIEHSKVGTIFCIWEIVYTACSIRTINQVCLG